MEPHSESVKLLENLTLLKMYTDEQRQGQRAERGLTGSHAANLPPHLKAVGLLQLGVSPSSPSILDEKNK